MPSEFYIFNVGMVFLLCNKLSVLKRAAALYATAINLLLSALIISYNIFQTVINPVYPSFLFIRIHFP